MEGYDWPVVTLADLDWTDGEQEYDLLGESAPDCPTLLLALNDTP